MDLGSLIGIIASTIVLVFAILVGSGFGIFINIPGIFIVIGGTFGITLMKYPLSKVVSYLKDALSAAFMEKTTSPRELIEMSVDISKTVKKNGVLALETYPIENVFFAKGIELVVDGHKPDFISGILKTEMKRTIAENESGANMLQGIADTAPGMGMIGTLVGLVQMLANLDDPATIGPAMAVALLTTLYGSLIAQVFGIPLAVKLNAKAAALKSTMSLIIESIYSIQTGLAPSLIEEVLTPYLSSDDKGKEGTDETKK